MTMAQARHVLDRFLRTDPADVGCEQALAALHAYVDLVVAGDNPEATYPGVTAHLRSCPPCAEDYDGLLITVR
jgi:hypothetical protein